MAGNGTDRAAQIEAKATSAARIAAAFQQARAARADARKRRDGVTTTEALRRLVGYGDLVYTAHANGNHILIERDDAVERITSIHT